MNTYTDTSLVYFKNKEDELLEALAFYEGAHTDSRGNPHIVSSDIIEELARKSNELLTQTDIPILTEHTKSPDNIRGVIKNANSFIARPVDASDILRNPKLSSALGKLGLFVSNIQLTDETLLNNIKNGIGKAISLGIDFKNKVVRELSFVTVPALTLASVFNNSELTYLFNMETTAVTLEEALNKGEDNEALKTETIDLLCTFLAVIENISAMGDEDLGNYQVSSKQELYQTQLERFTTMLDEKVNPFKEEADQQQQPQAAPMQQPQKQFSYPLAITTFDEMDQYLSEYGLARGLKLGLGLAKKNTGGVLSKAKSFAGGATRGTLGNKNTKAIGATIGGLKTKIGGGTATGIKPIKTGLANAASGGLNLGGKLGTKLGSSSTVGKKLVKTTSGLADRLGNRRLGRYTSNSKLSQFKSK